MNFSFKKTPSHFNVGCNYDVDFEHSKPFIKDHISEFRGTFGYLDSGTHLNMRICSDKYIPFVGHVYDVRVSMLDCDNHQIGALECILSEEKLDEIIDKR